MRRIFHLLNQINYYKELGDLKTINECKTDLAREVLNYLEANFYEIDEGPKSKLIYILSLMPNQLREIVDEYRYIASSARKLILLRILSYVPNLEYFRDAFIDFLNDKDAYVRATAVKILSSIATDREIVHIMKLLNDTDGRVVSNTLEAINYLDYSGGKTIYFRFKNNKHNRIKATSLKLLWENGHKDIYDALKDMIVSNDERTVASAFWLLSQVDFPQENILKIAEKFATVESRLIRVSAIKTILKKDPTLLNTFVRDNFVSEEIIQAVEEIKKQN